MRWRSRTRRFFKWVGLTVCVLIASAWPLSFALGTLYARYGRHVGMTFALRDGELLVDYDRLPFHGSEGWRTFRPGHAAGWLPNLPSRQSIVNTPDVESMLSYEDLASWKSAYKPTYDFSLLIPLWCPLAIVAVPTLLLWHRDRRPPMGHCQKCGYNLKGNTSGVCPECGTSATG